MITKSYMYTFITKKQHLGDNYTRRVTYEYRFYQSYRNKSREATPPQRCPAHCRRP